MTESINPAGAQCRRRCGGTRSLASKLPGTHTSGLRIFTTAEPDNSENAVMHRRIAEGAIVTRLHEFSRPQLVCRVETRGREKILSYRN